MILFPFQRRRLFVVHKDNFLKELLKYYTKLNFFYLLKIISSFFVLSNTCKSISILTLYRPNFCLTSKKVRKTKI